MNVFTMPFVTVVHFHTLHIHPKTAYASIFHFSLLYLIITAITCVLLNLAVDGHKLDKHVKISNWPEFGCLD